MKILRVILVFLGMGLVVFMPLIINWLFNVGEVTPYISTRFGHVDILVYIGAVLPLFATIIFSWLVLRQNKKLIDLQTQVHELEQRKILQDLADNTSAYLNITRVETTADCYPLKTHKLEKTVPWPLDVRATPIGYPNGIPQDFPRRWKKQIKKQLRPFPLGNSEDYREEIVEKKVFFSYKEEHSSIATTTHSPLIDPYEGIYNRGSISELVLWPQALAVPRDYPYYTQLGIDFYAKSSRENTFIREVEIHSFELRLESKGKNIYRFADRLHYFADIIRPHLRIKTTTVAENSYYGTTYNCDHVFSLQLHLCHFYADLLEVMKFNEMDIKFDVVYINSFGVRMMGSQGFKIGAFITEAVESKLLDAYGVPLKCETKKKAHLQHYLASDWELDFNHNKVIRQ